MDGRNAGTMQHTHTMHQGSARLERQDSSERKQQHVRVYIVAFEVFRKNFRLCGHKVSAHSPMIKEWQRLQILQVMRVTYSLSEDWHINYILGRSNRLCPPWKFAQK